MRSSWSVLILASSLALSAGANAAPRHNPCAVGEPRPMANLYFGLSIKGAPDLTDGQFSDFLDREVSTRFPDGLTVLAAQGRWRSDSGQMVREPSKVVQIIMSGKPDDLAKLDAVREAYKREFHQESVLEVVAKTCAAF
jgi:hypothetical protein